MGILQLPLEFELLERIFGILRLPLRVKEGGQSSYNLSLLSPPSIYDKILIKNANNSLFSILNLILGTQSMLYLITIYTSIIKPNNNKNERRKKGETPPNMSNDGAHQDSHNLRGLTMRILLHRL